MRFERMYYTLEEAAKVLDYSAFDLKHFIETEQLTPNLYSADKTFIALTWANRQWVAHGCCTYRGLLETYPNIMHSALRDKRLILEHPIRALNREMIAGWTVDYPFKNTTPNQLFHIWQPLHLSELSRPVYLLPLPIEHLLTGIEDLQTKTYQYSFNEQGTFTLDDIRLGHMAILAMQPRSGNSEDILKYRPEEELEKDSKPSNKLPRRNQLNELIIRIVKETDALRPGEVWKVFESEVTSNTRIYDIDEILVEVTASELKWVSRYGKSLVLKWSSFPSKLSKLRAKNLID